MASPNYRAIVENVSDILALIDAAGILLYVNPQLEAVLGFQPSEVVGRNIFDFVHPDDMTRAAQEYSDTIQKEGERIPSVVRLRDVAGQWIPFEIIANNRLHDPKIQAVIFDARDLRFRKDIEAIIASVNADIEKRVGDRTIELANINATLRLENQARLQAESKLQHTVSLLHATLDSTADGILVVSNTGKITSCNQKFLEMWSISCETKDRIDANDNALLSDVTFQLKDPNQFLDKVRALYADPSATSFDILHFKDGRIFERYSQPQRIGDEFVGRVWSFRDVTRSRNLELELRQSQKMEALGRLAGGIAHDFNNLLMLISGYVNQMLNNPNLAEGHDICDHILATTNRASAVTRQLLAFTRKHPDLPTVADLNVIVLNMEHLLRRLLSEQIQLQVSVTNEPQLIYADVSQIEVMIMNLSINAQDAMREGGFLSIATAREGDSSHDAGTEKGGTNFAVLQVSDTGYGMTPEVKANIFEPFFTTKELGKGTGLGLSTVFGIVQRAGGRIEVQSEPHHGTTFRVYLPLVTSARVAKPAVLSVVPPLHGNETILLAEDEAGIRAMTRAYLESMGYRVLEAADGAEAIRLSQEYAGDIQLVLTDILMPGMRGDSAVAEIRKERPDVKALYMSGYTDQIFMAESDAIVFKPFEFPELGRRLRSVLEFRSASASPRSDSAAD